MQIAATQSIPKKKKSEFLEITMTGTPFNMGVQYGEKAKHVIRRSSDYWYSQLAGTTERSKKDMIDMVWRSAEVSRKSFPEIHEEIEGVSKGSGVSVDDLLVATYNNAVTSVREMGCSNFAARGKATVDGEPILGRNLDYDYAVRNDMIIVRQKPSEGNAWLGSRCGAIVGVHEGINDKKIAGGWASVMQRPQERIDGMAFMQALQNAFLKASTAEEAAAVIAKMPKCIGGNYTFADKDEAIVIEAGSKGNHVRHEEGDIVLGTNHWRNEEMIERQGPNKLEVLGSPFCPRFVYGDRYLRSHSGKLGYADFEEMLSSHGSPGLIKTGICQHADPFRGTVCSSVSLPTKGLIYYAQGHGCSNTYETFALSGAAAS